MSESTDYDVIIVGAGPAGLSAAIKLKQLDNNIRVCVLEKGASIGAHSISGAVLIPSVLQTLLPDTWAQAPLLSPATHDAFYYLTKKSAIALPVPPQMRNAGNYIISLGELCQYLGQQAELLGCDIYPGFPAKEILYQHGQVTGVKTGAFGIDKNGQKTDHYQEGMCLHAPFTLFAEGCRGELSQTLMDYFHLREGREPQTYALGIKEVWRINPALHQEGHIIHTVGWPLDNKTYGGSFIYHYSNHRLSLGLVVGLDYKNPWLNPFEEMQQFKTHPFIKPLLLGGERLSYGARALNEGGYQAIPKLTFPGGALIGDAAGFLDVPKIKGIHNAMQSGIFAAESCFDILSQKNTAKKREKCILSSYEQRFNASCMKKSLYKARNIHPGFKYGLIKGLMNAFFETYISRGHSPWTLKNSIDSETLYKAKKCPQIVYPKPDNVVTFDKLSSVYLSNTYHEKNQPPHLILKDKDIAITVNYKEYASPETRYCPAAVYEITHINNEPSLVIHAENCIHCKTCDIKDKNIHWTAPEGGGGPGYMDM